jgi:hypothetical protein
VERTTFLGLTPFFKNLKALVLVLPLFTPGQDARSMFLQEKISPVHRPSYLKAKQRRGEKAYVVRSIGTPKDARKHLYTIKYRFLKHKMTIFLEFGLFVSTKIYIPLYMVDL